MKDPIVKGHPLHAILSDLPIGITIAGTIFDLLGLVLPAKQWRFAARSTHTLALLSGIAAALVGLWDYQAVPRDHPARRTGAVHGYLNASALLALLLSLTVRWRSGTNEPGESAKREPASAHGLSLLALLLLSIS
ncbi:MAG: DUF2231 domain-containing protein, partial [Chloroflexi bacterium]|nr:DUF2231 domain-containing protein [Chloroflexota bacterium]